MPAKSKAGKKQTGGGFFDTLKNNKILSALPGLVKALPAGYRPSDLLTKFTKNKTGAVGTIAPLLAGMLKQKGFGQCGGRKLLIPKDMMTGGGFFSDFAKGFAKPFEFIGNLATSAATPLIQAGLPILGALGQAKSLLGRGAGQRGGCGVSYPNSYSVSRSDLVNMF